MTLREFFFKLTFKPPLRQGKEWLRARSVRRRHEGWRNWHREHQSCPIDASIEIRDDKPITHENVRLGKWTAINRQVTIWLGGDPESRIDLGDRVFVGRNTCLGGAAPLSIGDDTMIGAYSYITTSNHGFSDLSIPMSQQGYTSAPVQLGRDVWIGAKVIILPGVTIGDHAIVGAGAIVTKSIPAGEIWAGVPARFLRRRTAEVRIPS
jgi:acetyltransferase-like isoleucine patch superfamily enzyme